MYARSGHRARAARARDVRARTARRLREAGCVFAEEEARLLVAAAHDERVLAQMVGRRASGLPLEQVLGWAELAGTRVGVHPGVFVPRHRTTLLVREAAAVCPPGALAVDLCCGSGAIGVALAARVRRLRLHAVDIDPAAVACAARNLSGFDAHVYEGDLFGPLPAALRGHVDLVTANAPYVPTSEIDLLPREARLHEPRRALDGGEDGLDVHRRIAAEAPAWLAAGGRLVVEIAEHQVPDLVGIMARAGLSARVVRDAKLEASVIVAAATPLVAR